eukprot:SAG31_NODE_23799_length_495_cov_1.017677_1_plen_49_part_10
MTPPPPPQEYYKTGPELPGDATGLDEESSPGMRQTKQLSSVLADVRTLT